MADEFNWLYPLGELDNGVLPVTVDEMNEFIDCRNEFPNVTEQEKPDNGQWNSS